jgi:thymidine kinase
MAKLYFYFSAMNAGKSTTLLQSSHNYHERGMQTLLFCPAIDNRVQTGKIHSRIGLDANAVVFEKYSNLFNYAKNEYKKNKIACVLIDEAQFLTEQQVHELTEIVDKIKIPVLAYGLRSDFLGNLFEGSKYLLAWADEMVEIKTICFCGKKAIMNMRIDKDGNKITEGEQVQIGGNESYISTCREHFKQGVSRNENAKAPEKEAIAP